MNKEIIQEINLVGKQIEDKLINQEELNSGDLLNLLTLHLAKEEMNENE